MAVPKKRTGHSAQGHRRSNWKATKPETTKCSNCGELVLTHTVCTACGYYKSKAVSIKSPDYVDSTIESKKPAKKTTKKSESKSEAKSETKTKTKKTEKKIEDKEVETIEVSEKVEDTTAGVVEEVKADEVEKTEE